MIDPKAGTSRRLTKQSAPYADGYAIESRFSRDGRHVAFGWSTASSFDLRIVRTDGSSLRVIYANNPEVEYINPAGWSPDSRRILVSTQTRSRTAQIALISIADGAAVVLRPLPWGTSATSVCRAASSDPGDFGLPWRAALRRTFTHVKRVNAAGSRRRETNVTVGGCRIQARSCQRQHRKLTEH